jgi:general secretion pathway protein A
VYEAFYGFIEKPFNLTPDPKYLYLSARHTEAFGHLEYGRRERGGFSVITGEVGTGKTTLARYFLGGLESKTATAVVLYPALTAAELLRSILEDLHIPVTGTTLKDHVDALHRFVLAARAEGRDVVLLIDEAQDLSPEVLEQVRLISNLETDTQKLIHIVLMGQSELQEMLERHDLRQLAQRITARYHLSPLSRDEVSEYIRHRLVIAGGDGKVTFTTGALRAIHRLSRGVPRLVNLICDRSLLGGYVNGTRAIDAAIVQRAAAEVRGESGVVRKSPWRYLLALGLALVGIAATVGIPALRSAPARSEAAALTESSALPAPALALPTLAPTPTRSPLEPVLLSLGRDVSYGAAMSEIQALWGHTNLARTELRTHLDQVRRFDFPVILEMFHPVRRDTCYIALLRISGDTAILGYGVGTPMAAPLSEVDRLWTRQAVFVWHDPESLSRLPDDEPRSMAWALAELERMGYSSAGGVRPAVAQFQRDTEIQPDGIIGTRTIMAIYSRLDRPRPRLAGGAS